MDQVCFPSMMSYTIRVHPPNVSQAATEYFDKTMKEIWMNAAEVQEQAWTADLAALPIRYGGCGFTRSSPIRKYAYEASYRAAFGEGGETQKEATERYYRG